MKRTLAAAGLLMTLAVAVDAEASGQGFLYVVNATGYPFRMALDGQPSSPEMAHLVGALRLVEPGSHVLSGQVVGEPAATTKLNLVEGNSVTVQEAGSGKVVGVFWCILVGRRPNAELAFIAPTQPECASLVRDWAASLNKIPAS